MTASRSYYVRKAIVFLLFFAVCGDIQGLPRSKGAPRQSLSGKISIGEKEVIAEIEYSLSEAFGLACGMGLAIDESSVSSPYIKYSSPDYVAFLGSGKAGDGMALKLKPYSVTRPYSDSLCFACDEGVKDSLLFGFGSGWLKLFVLAVPKSIQDEADVHDNASNLSRLFSESFRCAGVELSRAAENLSFAFSASLSDRPAEASGDGWRAGVSFIPGSTFFTLASAARMASGNSQAGIWISGSAGYLENPGLAASLDWSSKTPINVLGSNPASIGVNFSVFASSQSYRTASGEVPLYDFCADAKASIKGQSWDFAARIMAGSLSEDASPCGKQALISGDLKATEALLWLWRTDLLSIAADAGFGAVGFAARFYADAGGWRSGSLTLRYSQLPVHSRPLTFLAAGKLSFSRNGIAEDEDDYPATTEADDEEDIAGSGGLSLREWLTKGPVDGIRLRSVGSECGLRWKDSVSRTWLGQGSVKIGVSAKRADSLFSFSASGELAQKILVLGNLAVTLILKSPEGGYALDALPTRFPNLTLGFSTAWD